MNLTDLNGLNLQTIFDNIAKAAGPLTGVLALLAFTALADVATGIYAAIKSGSFDVAYLDSFLTDHVLNKWAPIVGTLLGGIMIGGVDNVLGSTLIVAASGQIIAYEATVFGGSIAGNFRAASTKSKGLPGVVGLAQLVESQTFDIPAATVAPHTHDAPPPAPVAPPPPPPPPPPVVTVNGAPVMAHLDADGRIVID
jgi:hypothetical protein